MGRALLVLETEFDRRKATDWISRAPVGTRVEFKASKRTLPQNDMLWALLTEVAQQLGHAGKKYDPSQWKAIFLHAFGREVSFLPSLDQKTFLPIELSSSDLSKDEMTDFIEFIMKEAAERGVVFKDHRNQETTESGSSVPSREPVTAEDVPNASAASDDVSPASSDATPTENDRLIKYAGDVLRLAATNGISLDVLKDVDKEWAAEIKAMSEHGVKKARAISDSSRAIFNDPARLDGVLDHYAKVLECSVEEIGGNNG